MSAWLDQLFDAAIASKDGVVRRSKRDVNKYASLDDLLFQVRERGFHLIETGGQYVILCNKGALLIHC